MKQNPYRNRSNPPESAGAKQRLSQLFDIPQSAMAGTQIEIADNQEAVIDGCQGILVYDEHIIRLGCKKMVLTFLGRGLQIKALTPTSAVVSGHIEKIEFGV
jgi:YabP family.